MKQLLTDRFGRAFLSDIEHFKWKVIRTMDKPNGQILMDFEWEWNGFFGFGQLDYKDGRVMNVFGNNYSNITVSSKCTKFSQSNKPNCALYNDKDLEAVFNYMLRNIG